MDWLYLFIAGGLETFWAVCLKESAGFSRLWPSVLTVAGMAASFLFLSLALKNLPLGTAYAVWTGIGAVGTVILGILLFHEPASPIRLLCLALILCGILGLKLSSGA